MRRWILVAVSVGLLIPGVSLGAQRPISIGLAGGVSLPQGELSDAAKVGWHALGTVGLSNLMQPIGFRLDLAYNQFEFSEDVAAAVDDGSQAVGSATLNITYRLPMTNSPMSPYVISGLGAYQTRCSGTPGCEVQTHYGWNVGLGAKLSVLPIRTFVEARYHRTERGSRNVNYFPLSFGVVF